MGLYQGIDGDLNLISIASTCFTKTDRQMDGQPDKL